MKRQLVAVVAALSALASLPAAAQFQKPEDAVKYRKAAFQVMAAHFGRIGAMATGKAPFDAAAALSNAEAAAFMWPLVVPCGIEAQNHWSSSSPVGMWAGCI